MINIHQKFHSKFISHEHETELTEYSNRTFFHVYLPFQRVQFYLIFVSLIHFFIIVSIFLRRLLETQEKKTEKKWI